MPTVVRHGPYRFYFWSHEPDEPPHIQPAARAARGTAERAFAGGGYGIHWPDGDEDLSTDRLLRGPPASRRKLAQA